MGRPKTAKGVGNERKEKKNCGIEATAEGDKGTSFSPMMTQKTFKVPSSKGEGEGKNPRGYGRGGGVEGKKGKGGKKDDIRGPDQANGNRKWAFGPKKQVPKKSDQQKTKEERDMRAG